MSLYLADTTVPTAGLFRPPAAVALLTPWITQREVRTSILVYKEIVEYLHSLPNFARHHRELRELLREVSPILSPTP